MSLGGLAISNSFHEGAIQGGLGLKLRKNGLFYTKIDEIFT